MKKELIKFVILALVLVSGCSADLATKGIIKNTIKDDSVPVIENFLNFTYVENHAIAF
ncbi:MAG: hypothetical protein MI922_30720 [Bacteroidales bacterium]|nr:hypothetical protein [Bacteroidales bacterium]